MTHLNALHVLLNCEIGGLNYFRIAKNKLIENSLCKNVYTSSSLFSFEGQLCTL